jgi:hypothetical protein
VCDFGPNFGSGLSKRKLTLCISLELLRLLGTVMTISVNSLHSTNGENGA